MRIIKIGFDLSKSESDEEYNSSSWVESADERSDEKIIGYQLNSFLKQARYNRPNDYIFMESLTASELHAVEDFIKAYRKNQREATN